MARADLLCELIKSGLIKDDSCAPPRFRNQYIIKSFRCHRKLQKFQKRIFALTAFYVIFLFSAIR